MGDAFTDSTKHIVPPPLRRPTKDPADVRLKNAIIAMIKTYEYEVATSKPAGLSGLFTFKFSPRPGVAQIAFAARNGEFIVWGPKTTDAFMAVLDKAQISQIRMIFDEHHPNRDEQLALQERNARLAEADDLLSSVGL